jgi:hypothetical protein
MQDLGCNLFKILPDVKRMPAAIDAKRYPFDLAALKIHGSYDICYT